MSSSFQAWSGARQRQGWQPLGWLQQEAIYLARISLKQEAIYVAVALYFPKVALYFPKLATTFYRLQHVLCQAGRQNAQ